MSVFVLTGNKRKTVERSKTEEKPLKSALVSLLYVLFDLSVKLFRL